MEIFPLRSPADIPAPIGKAADYLEGSLLKAHSN